MAIDPVIIRNELDVLGQELRQLLRDAGARHADSNAQTSSEPVAAAIDVLSAALNEADVEVERLIRARPIIATAAAFAIGMTIGLLLRRS
ncbi:hypothetical protein [Bradyrhizobium aeschynomenes]|uniref:hypothetical protein n=1 Tax=Bradyrhizobium aeschynomenes TaxID=2734909 RepID=UPI001555E02D|nr:hypothetical protein [Bradyrhizobium aeschynomenes]NPV22879.1 hypothetical protein [Bradyrhizobium aeschynomenes]